MKWRPTLDPDTSCQIRHFPFLSRNSEIWRFWLIWTSNLKQNTKQRVLSLFPWQRKRQRPPTNRKILESNMATLVFTISVPKRFRRCRWSQSPFRHRYHTHTTFGKWVVKSSLDFTYQETQYPRFVYLFSFRIFHKRKSFSAKEERNEANAMSRLSAITP